MCGIVGYIGRQRALPILIEGLKDLEYRGYDSAGLLTADGSRVRLARAVGKVAALEANVSRRASRFPGSAGIAHTRWATHGNVSVRNTHPHADCRSEIFVAHNGIIENWKELRLRLARSDHRFRSETDTEVIPHLIEEARRRNPKLAFEDAVRLALKAVKGTYGLAICSSRDPDKLVAARNFSPLLLGIGNDEFMVASDAAAVSKLTRDVLYLKNGEIATLTPEGYRIVTIENRAVSRKSEKLERAGADAGRGSYPHFMLKEICEEPDAVRNSIRGRLLASEGKARLGGLKEVEDRLRAAERILISGCGSAAIAGRVGEYMLEEYAGIPAEVDSASEFRYRKPVVRAGDVFLAISQSGETADTLAALAEAKEKDVLTLGLVNVVGSSIARETHAGVYQHAGPEIGVAATKSFASQVAILALLTLLLGRQRQLSLTMGKRIAEELARIPALMERILRRRPVLARLARKYGKFENFLYLGRKYNFPVAMEGALKLKEIAYAHAEGLSAGEMKHGPIAMIDRSLPSIVIAPKDSVYEKILSNIEEIKARGGPVLAIATEGDQKIGKIANDVFFIPKTLEMLTPLLTALPLHLFAYHAGVLRGRDVDKPRNLAKSVTVE